MKSNSIITLSLAVMVFGLAIVSCHNKDENDHTEPPKGNNATAEVVGQQPERDRYVQLLDSAEKVKVLGIPFSYTEIPPSISRFVNLEKLHLLENPEIESLPQEITELRKLKYLDVGTCPKLKNFMDVVCELESLETLVIHKTSVNSIPKNIKKLKRLRWLSMMNTAIDSLPLEFGDLENLEMLDIRNTKITSFPDEMGKLKNLKEIYIYPINKGARDKLKSLLPNTEIIY